MAINIRKKDDKKGPEEGEGNEQEAPIPDEAAADADPFVRNSVDAVTWFSNNQNTVIGGIAVAVVVGIAAYVAYNQYRSGLVEASSSWGEAVERFERPVSGSEYVTSIKRTDFTLPSEYIYEDLETKWTEIHNKAVTTLENYPKSRVAEQARLTRAAAAYRLGNYEESIEQYETYLEDKPSEDLKPVVYYGAGLAYGAAGKVDKAVEMFTKLSEADSSYEILALYHKGMVHEEAGHLKKATEMYDKALDSSSSSPYHTDIKRRRTLISVRD